VHMRFTEDDEGATVWTAPIPQPTDRAPDAGAPPAAQTSDEPEPKD